MFEFLLGLYLLSIPAPAVMGFQDVRQALTDPKRPTTRGGLITTVFVCFAATVVPVFNTILSGVVLNDYWHQFFGQRWENWMNTPVGAYAKKQNEKALAKEGVSVYTNRQPTQETI